MLSLDDVASWDGASLHGGPGGGVVGTDETWGSKVSETERVVVEAQWQLGRDGRDDSVAGVTSW